MAEPIRIIITQGGTGGEGLTGGVTPKGRDTGFGQELNKLNIGFSKKEMIALSGLVIAASRKALVNSINNTARMTGSYMETTQLNDKIQMVTHIGGTILAGVGIAKAVGAGLISSPAGIIAIGALVVNEAMNLHQENMLFQLSVNKTNFQAERARIRAGTPLANGSRGTNE